MKRVISLVVVLAMVLAVPVLAGAEDSFGVGSAQGNSYWNDALQIGCTMSDEWYFYTDEEIMENVQSTAGQLKEELAEMVKEAGTMMDMMAVNTETGENVNVNLERLSLANSLLMTESAYVEVSLNQIKQLADTLEQLGMEDISVETGEMEFLGETHACLRVHGSLQGIDMYETLVVVKTGRTMIAVTACSYWEDTTEEILSNFYREQP